MGVQKLQNKTKIKRIGLITGVLFLGLLGIIIFFQGQLTLTPWEKHIGLETPSNIVTDADGNYLVIDKGSSRVSCISRDGNWLFSIESGRNENKTFQNALGVNRAVDGKLYIRDVVWKSNGMDVKSERILRYSASGAFEQIVYNVDYTKMDEGVYKPCVYGPFFQEDTTYVILVEENAILFKNISDDTLIRQVDYKNAGKLISDFEVDANGNLYFVDKRGLILCESETGELKTLYQGYGKIGAECSLPWDLSVNQNGDCVFTDLGKRTVERLEKDGSISNCISRGEVLDTQTEQFGDNPILYQVNLGEDGQIAVPYNESVFVVQDGTVLLNSDQIPIDEGTVVKHWALFVVFILAVLLGVTALVCLTVSLISLIQISTGSKIACIVLFSMVAAGTIVATVSFQTTNKQYIDMAFNRMLIAAQDVTEVVDVDALEQIDSPDDYFNDDYLRLKDSLESVVNKKYAWNRDIYCNIYRYQDSVLYAPIYLDQSVGAFYPLPAYDEIEVIETGEIKQFYMSQTSSGMWMYVYVPLYNDAEEIVGLVDVGMDMNSYVKQTQSMYIHIAFSVLAACVIMQMLILQGISYYEFHLKRKKLRLENGGVLEREPIGFLQPIVFTVFFAFNLPTAFLPNYCNHFYIPMMGLPKEFMIALPISLNLFMTAISSLASSFFIERIGPRKVGIFGSILTAISYLGVAASNHYFWFTLTMAFTGIGLGTVLNSVNSYIAMQRDENEKASGFTIYNTAFFAGINCGTVIGAFLASSMGYRMVFVLVAVCMLLPMLLIWKYMFNTHLCRTSVHEEEHSAVSLPRFVFNPKILLFLVFAYVPYMLAGHFLYYFLPIFGITLGLSETTIGQLFLVNGIGVLLLTWISNELFIKRLKLRLSVMSALLIFAVAFFLFSYMRSISGVVITILLLSVANSFGASAMSLYFSEQNITRRYGSGKAMGIFSLFENIGDTAGPFVFSFVLAGSLFRGFQMLAFSYGIAAILFILSSFARRQRSKQATTE